MSRWNFRDEQNNDEWDAGSYDSNDEREIEFVDLDSDKEDAFPDDAPVGDEPGETKPERRRHRVSLAPRFSVKQRRTQAAATVSFVGLLLVIVLVSYAPTRQTLGRAFTVHITPTGTLAPGVDRFYIGGEPPWGHLLVDGKRVMHLPDPIHGEPPLHLSRGKHTLTWVANPFPARSCTISVPPSYRVDSCNVNAFVGMNTQNSAWLFSFPVTLLDLPLNMEEALIQAAQNALDSNAPSDTVHPGERYATNDAQHPYTVAKEPLVATLHYQLDVSDLSVSTCSTVDIIDNNECAFEAQDCHIFCTAPQLFSSALTAQSWDVLAVASYTWDYRTLDGKSVARNQPDQPKGVTPQNHLIPLSITWDGTQWRVQSKLSQLDGSVFQGSVRTQMEPACASAESNVAGDKSLMSVPPGNHGTNWAYTSADNPAVGCLGIVTLDEGVTPTPQQTPAYCLHRFGVFLAANRVAHDNWPSMPLADSYEQKLAQQLYANYDVFQS